MYEIKWDGRKMAPSHLGDLKLKRYAEQDAAFLPKGGDCPAVGFCDGLSQGEADARAARVRGARFVETVEAVEETVQVRAFRQNAGVKDLHVHAIVPLADRQTDFTALVRVADGVVQEEGQHLLDGISVACVQIEDLEIFENVAYIMAYHADNSIPPTIEEWLDEFDMFSIYEVLPQILELWGENLVTDVTSKKRLAEVSGK